MNIEELIKKKLRLEAEIEKIKKQIRTEQNKLWKHKKK